MPCIIHHLQNVLYELVLFQLFQCVPTIPTDGNVGDLAMLEQNEEFSAEPETIHEGPDYSHSNQLSCV